MFRFTGAAARLVFAALTISAFSAASEAQYITYVATNGNDANPCVAVTAPCKTLQRAVNVTPANGTVRVLTPLQSSVFINKNITISGDGVPIVGQITIGGATAVVTLRGLNLDGVGGYLNGIRIDSAAAVHIEDCTLEHYTNDGIRLVATTVTKLFVLDTVSRDNVGTGDGLYAENINATVEIVNSHFDRNASSGVYLKVAEASVTGSSASGNAQHGFIVASNATITETTANNNSGDGFSVRQGGTILDSVKAINNGSNGLQTEDTGSARFRDSVFVRNDLDINNLGSASSFQNNIFGTDTGNAIILAVFQ